MVGQKQPGFSDIDSINTAEGSPFSSCAIFHSAEKETVLPRYVHGATIIYIVTNRTVDVLAASGIWGESVSRHHGVPGIFRSYVLIVR